MKILGVDSSAKSASVCITEDERLISEAYVNIGLTHSETLAPMVKSCLDNVGLNFEGIDALCVTNGPGSFTGIRIGVSTVKGLASVNNKPCVGVSTLEAMAYCNIDFNGIICCTMDARCNQVYCALFDCNKKTVKRLTEDIAISIEELYNKLISVDESVLLCGDGAEICYKAFSERTDKVTIAQELTRFQRAYGACLCALNNKSFVPAEKLNPVYIRPSQAERELKKKKETN